MFSNAMACMEDMGIEQGVHEFDFAQVVGEGRDEEALVDSSG